MDRDGGGTAALNAAAVAVASATSASDLERQLRSQIEALAAGSDALSLGKLNTALGMLLFRENRFSDAVRAGDDGAPGFARPTHS